MNIIQGKKRFYLMNGRSFYGVMPLLGENVIMTTTIQSEANVFYEEEIDHQIQELRKRKVKVKAVEILDGNLRATRGRGVLHQIVEEDET